LPETGDELRRVAASVGAPANAVVTGRAATESALRSRPLDQYRVLYFATHGLLPGELRCQSEPGLALSSPERPPSSPSEDGLLDASEIAGLRLAADLVVLSACNTAVSAEELGGEALEGLSDSFFHAGVRAIVASHWSVPSASTTELMVTMFQKLGPNLQDGVAESLRSAQLAMMDRRPTSHPLFWAAFTVLGDGGRGDVLAAEDRR
jgi:CHAT domain-containing protein